MSRENLIELSDEDTISDGVKVRPLVKESVYYAARDGLSIALYALLSNIPNEVTKNAIINQVSGAILKQFFFNNF